MYSVVARTQQRMPVGTFRHQATELRGAIKMIDLFLFGKFCVRGGRKSASLKLIVQPSGGGQEFSSHKPIRNLSRAKFTAAIEA